METTTTTTTTTKPSWGNTVFVTELIIIFKAMKQLINQLLILIGIRTIITATVHNNYIVYCKSNHKYYNLLPLKVGQVVYLGQDTTKYTILKKYPNNNYKILDEYKFFGDKIESGNKLCAYRVHSKVTGYINGAFFIVTGTE